MITGRARLVRTCALAVVVGTTMLSCSLHDIVSVALGGPLIVGGDEVVVGGTIELSAAYRDCDRQNCAVTNGMLAVWRSSVPSVGALESMPGVPENAMDLGAPRVRIRGLSPGRTTISVSIRGEVSTHDVRVIRP
jgi:hypothetical protein